MAEDTVLDILSVSTGYRAQPVLDNVTLKISKGQFFGLIGLNGVGKTTLIKSILGLHPFKSGEIKVFGRDVSHADSKREITYLPERFEPPWFLSGAEFIDFSMGLYGKKPDRRRMLDYAEKLDLDIRALDRRVQTYSKGMRQKLGLMATILTDCSLIILDEPMSGLDPRARNLVKNCMLDLKAMNRTVFFSSHILADMDEMCDEVAVLHNQHIQYTGSPAGLRKTAGGKTLETAFLKIIA